MGEDPVPGLPGGGPTAACADAERERLFQGRSLRVAAREVGVSHETLRQWERGRAPQLHQRPRYRAWLARYAGRLS